MAAHIDPVTSNCKIKTLSASLEYDITRNLDRRFICPICLGIMQKPMQTKCGHRFCSECILAVIGSRERTKCPVDNTLFVTGSEIFSDLAFEREINSLATSCPNRDEGCDWFAELTLWKEHVTNCPYGSVACEDCGLSMTLKDLSKHRSSDCPHRMVDCEHCKQQMPAIDKMKHHLVTCQKFPVTCTQCGLTGFQRDNISLHTDNKSGNCPATIIPCYYQPFGCHYMDQRQNIMHHLTGAAEHHHLILVNEMTRLEHRLLSVQHEFTNHLLASHEIQNKLQDIQRTVGMKDTVQKIFKENYLGHILWQVDVTLTKTRMFHSPSFYTANPGYRVSASLDLTSFQDNFDAFVSFSLTIKDGKYDELLSFPFSGLCQVTVFDQSENYIKNNHSAFVLCHALPRFSRHAEKSSSRDYKTFMKASDFLSDRYTRNGTVFIEVKVMQAVFSLC